MKTPNFTVDHEFHSQSGYSVFAAESDVPVHVSLAAAALLLESVVSGLQALISIPEASTNATLICFATDSALALVYAAQAGAASQMDESENVVRESGGEQ